MPDDFIVIEVQDWSAISPAHLKYNEDIFCYRDADSCGSNNLGIFLWGEKEPRQYHTSGYVGICVLKNKDGGHYLNAEGKKVLLKVMPRFDLSPWLMLSEVISDNEYEEYEKSSELEGKKIYEISDDERPIRLPVDSFGGEVILAISFIRACYKVCSGIMCRKMEFIQENLNGRIRGRIDFSNQIKQNIAMGREDRIFCKYLSFTEDTIENRIIKKALVFSERILQVNNCLYVKGLSKIHEMLLFSKKRLNKVRDVLIKKSDFVTVNLTGFNTVYKPAINLAELLLTHTEMSLSNKGEKTGYVLPYAIRMETIFEFYVRAVIKRFLKLNHKKYGGIQIERFKSRDDNELLLTTDAKDVYIMSHYIPDIAFQQYNSEKQALEYVAVFDVKYQHSKQASNNVVRKNSHQLLFYTLLLNVGRCGFIFPAENGQTEVYKEANLIIQDSNLSAKDARVYSEFYLSSDENRQRIIIDKIMECLKIKEMMI